MFFKRLYKVIGVGLGFESYSEVVDDEAEHDVSSVVFKQAWLVRSHVRLGV
jgi:hypothetical protein